MIKIIDVDKLGFSYNEETRILDNLSFHVNKGEVFGFLGPNGAGKSTTQKILIGMLKNYQGSVKILGKEIRDWDEKVYLDLSVLFEYPYVYTNLNAYDNLNYFASFYPNDQRQDIDFLLDKLELKTNFRSKIANSYSKGMKQRLSMARALISSPKILFLDEPTSGLDPAGAVLFRQIINEEKAKGTTIFLTTHNMHDAELLCDRIAFIVDGNIKAIDTPIGYKEKYAENEVVVKYKNNGNIVENKFVKKNFFDELTQLKNVSNEIISIHSKEPNIEDIFIKITGKELAKVDKANNIS